MHYFKDVRYFQTFIQEDKEPIVLQLCRRLTLVCYGDSELLFKKGDAPKLFYVVVKGCVNIYLSRERYLGESKIDGVTVGQEEARKQGLGYCERIKDKYGGVTLSKFIDDPFFFDQKTYDFKHHLASAVLPGNSFGELAVMRSAPRAATAITKGKTYLAALDSESFRKILHFEQAQKIEKKMRFFKENMLGELDYNDQVKIAYYFTSKKYSKGQVVYQQGETVKQVYLVKAGRVELHTFSTTDVLNLASIEKDKNLLKILQFNATEIFGIINSRKLSQKVTEIGEKNILADWGESKKVKGIFTQLYTALAISEEVELYECSFHNFCWIRDNYPKLWRSISGQIQAKNRSREEFIRKVQDIRTRTEKEAKDITSTNIQVKMFAIQNNSAEFSQITAEEQRLENNCNREDVKNIDKIVKAKAKVLEQLKLRFQPPEDPDKWKDIDKNVTRKRNVRLLELNRETNIKQFPGDIRQPLAYNNFIKYFRSKSLEPEEQEALDHRTLRSRSIDHHTQTFLTIRGDTFASFSHSRSKNLQSSVEFLNANQLTKIHEKEQEDSHSEHRRAALKAARYSVVRSRADKNRSLNASTHDATSVNKKSGPQLVESRWRAGSRSPQKSANIIISGSLLGGQTDGTARHWKHSSAEAINSREARPRQPSGNSLQLRNTLRKRFNLREQIMQKRALQSSLPDRHGGLQAKGGFGLKAEPITSVRANPNLKFHSQTASKIAQSRGKTVEGC